MNANHTQLKQASEILRREFPQVLIGRTVDECKNCTAIEREILVRTQNIYPPRLLQINPR